MQGADSYVCVGGGDMCVKDNKGKSKNMNGLSLGHSCQHPCAVAIGSSHNLSSWPGH